MKILDTKKRKKLKFWISRKLILKSLVNSKQCKFTENALKNCDDFCTLKVWNLVKKKLKCVLSTKIFSNKLKEIKNETKKNFTLWGLMILKSKITKTIMTFVVKLSLRKLVRSWNTCGIWGPRRIFSATYRLQILKVFQIFLKNFQSHFIRKTPNWCITKMRTDFNFKSFYRKFESCESQT